VCGGFVFVVDLRIRRLARAQRFQQRLRSLSNATHAFAEASRSPDLIFDTVVREVVHSLDCVCTLSLLQDDGVHFNLAVHGYDTSDPREVRARFQEAELNGPRRVLGQPS
jgi:hypothetical protein